MMLTRLSLFNIARRSSVSVAPHQSLHFLKSKVKLGTPQILLIPEQLRLSHRVVSRSEGDSCKDVLCCKKCSKVMNPYFHPTKKRKEKAPRKGAYLMAVAKCPLLASTSESQVVEQLLKELHPRDVQETLQSALGFSLRDDHIRPTIDAAKSRVVSGCLVGPAMPAFNDVRARANY